LRMTYARTPPTEVDRDGYGLAKVEPARCTARSPPDRRSL
jgi:hypothetical protein